MPIFISFLQNTIFLLLKETLLSFFGKLPFKIALERYYTRKLRRYLLKVSAMDTNTFGYDAANAMLNALKANGLRTAEEAKPERSNMEVELTSG